MKKSLLALGLTLMAVSQASAWDNEYFKDHLRKALNIDTRVEIKITSQPAPSGFGNLLSLPITVGNNPYVVFISPDEKQYIWGYSLDLTKDPDKERADVISLKKVHSKGSATAPVTVVEYSDLQCSHCKRAHEILKNDLYKQYTQDQVRLVFKHFPLSGHDWAEPAAVATECAARERSGAFWEMADMFFNDSQTIKKETVRQKSEEYAGRLKLGMDKFRACLDNPSALDKVKADKKEGLAVGVTSTPTLFINGRSRRGFGDFKDVSVVIDEKLAELKK